MFLLRIFTVLFTVSIFNFFQKSATNARVILEDVSGKQQTGYQVVGEKGKAAFQYLNEGSYRLKIVFPQQEGKWVRAKHRYNTLTKAAYNPKNKTYYYQGKEGYFSVKFSHIRKIKKDQFKTVFREDRREENNGIVIAEFQSRKGGAGLQVTVNAITESRFKKKTRNGDNDITLFSIPGMK